MIPSKPEPDGQTRIALYGGAFDPIHHAHLAIASAALTQASLTQVIFIPSAQSPLKAHAPMAADDERLEMLRLAIADQGAFSVDTSEVEKGGISYTIETVRHFCREYPEAKLFWILGGDQLAQLDRWFEIDELVQLVTFLVVARPEAGKPSILSGLTIQELFLPPMTESSTEIRQRIQSGHSIEGMTPHKVATFIDRRKLYRSQ